MSDIQSSNADGWSVDPDSAVDAEEERRFYSPLEFAAAVYNRVLVATVVYVLSIGPMFWHWHEATFLHGEPFVAKLYYPLLIACTICPPFGDWVNWYINLWIT